MERHHLIYLAAGASVALLAGAFLFQFLGWAPCQLCLWQRWPHVVAGVIGLMAVGIGGRGLPALGAATMAVSAGLAAYHTGVERKWWQGPSSCSGDAPLAGDGGMLLPGAESEAPALVMCDQVQPFFLSLTMANWNLLMSLALVVLWLVAARRLA
ncbi:disulfide bond formation protein B [Lutimaribacter sp. EGI FJ00015]|uniref:Disulfide bond formation protein B n=1 Tax=Lutimaribacter degradans TaxID=2945989 RepID=A0ACC5ZVP0_9RHOB|nr:disulfide bond formation protein B [Lutimaribacter sp. EGI FJ00013]MCM2562376.1 disulfide bond formation protein B [Lutimaribacter sp. EGI FJ00013]MCO0613533.1 disulfide bond formation protein B [Lutimaribacter sp. EGI FJ00015]MCO0636505.1 disulfide bond formation protein B [Lutimaribacter sp. EGI FJ00014]